MMIEGEHELVAMVACFRAMIADWGLAPWEVAALLQVERGTLGLDLVPKAVAPCEHRMRLILEIGSMIGIVTNGSAPRDWLHARDLPYDPSRVTPLQFLSGPLSNLRALRSLLSLHA